MPRVLTLGIALSARRQPAVASGEHTILDTRRPHRHVETMPLKVLIGPIAAATIVTAFWFAAMWRGHQIERAGRKLPRRYAIALFGYIGALGLVVYFMQGANVSTGLEIFAATLSGEGLGIIIVAMLVEAFVLSRDRRWSDRAMPIVFGLLLAGSVFAVVLTT